VEKSRIENLQVQVSDTTMLNKAMQLETKETATGFSDAITVKPGVPSFGLGAKVG
jgi:hypothetical protein